ncbi:hypothetical protein C8J56DRAFT_969491 [Mycena floridula]|nr:hypothetical protein C8J56DRAFT_969491 [Mycena floridula]
MDAREPFTGPRRKLVLGFDVGTTFSGVSYSVLDPGTVPEIKAVTRFPAQEQVGGDAKIPSIIYYDEHGTFQGAGAEALELKDWIVENDKQKAWSLAQWFKLHLRPRNVQGYQIGSLIPSLPPGKTVVQVFADFLKYLFHCAKIYIQESYPNGLDFWATIEDNIDFVLTHPNGWGGAQQAQMRQAAELAGIIPNSGDGQARIRFVTEGEASLHFCIHHGLAGYASRPDEGVIIVDAGGGTLDITSYAGSPSGSFQEIARPACHFKGSVFVRDQAETFLAQHLSGPRFTVDLEHITHCFDSGAKMKFKTAADPSFIKFGSMSDKDPERGIKGGTLKLAGAEVAGFFEPSIQAICQTVLAQQAATPKTITSIFLVGGFAASEYLFTTLQARLESQNLTFCRPDSHVNKAVADGAVSFYLDHFVTDRMSKFTYGVRCSTQFDPSNIEHSSRDSDMYTDVDGTQMLPNKFDIILPKDTLVSETKEFRRPYVQSFRTPLPEKKSCQVFILCYSGRDPKPRWTDIDTAMYSRVCSIVGDFSDAFRTLQPQTRIEGLPPYYRIHYEVVLMFGLTELKAHIAWKEDGVEKRFAALSSHPT